MRRYETIVILDPELSEDGRAPIYERLDDIMAQKKGLMIDREEWGTKKLAYEIKRKLRGFYVRLEYCGTGALVSEVERFFRIEDRVLKFMTIVVDESPDMERIQQELAASETAGEEAAAEEKAEESSPSSSEGSEPEAVAAEEASTESKKEE